MHSFWFKANNFNSRFYFSKAGFPTCFFCTFGNKKRLKRRSFWDFFFNLSSLYPHIANYQPKRFVRLARVSFVDEWLNKSSVIKLETTSAAIMIKNALILNLLDFINSDGLLQAPLSSVTHQSLLNYIINYSSPLNSSLASPLLILNISISYNCSMPLSS